MLETRMVREGAAIRRRRECLRCQHRFTTYEYVEAASFQVVKKDGRREPFQRAKVLGGLVRACEKRPVSRAVIDDLIDRIEQALVQTGKTEVDSAAIGRRVLEHLRDLDPVAYVRFASVYLNFNDIGQFLDTIEGLPRQVAAEGNAASPEAASENSHQDSSGNPSESDSGNPPEDGSGQPKEETGQEETDRTS